MLPLLSANRSQPRVTMGHGSRQAQRLPRAMPRRWRELMVNGADGPRGGLQRLPGLRLPVGETRFGRLRDNGS